MLVQQIKRLTLFTFIILIHYSEVKWNNYISPHNCGISSILKLRNSITTGAELNSSPILAAGISGEKSQRYVWHPGPQKQSLSITWFVQQSALMSWLWLLAGGGSKNCIFIVFNIVTHCVFQHFQHFPRDNAWILVKMNHIGKYRPF